MHFATHPFFYSGTGYAALPDPLAVQPGLEDGDVLELVRRCQKGFAGQTTADKRTLPWVNEDFSVCLPCYDPINDAGDVLNNDRYIDTVYRMNDGMSEAGRAHFALFDRAALLDMVRVLMEVFPPKDQHPWGEEEFYQAARFYRGFVECYQNLEQTENSQLAMMRKAYGAVK